MGSSYTPNETTLGDMYGIGYCKGDSASFITGTASGFGMYIASDGDARVFFGASSTSKGYINTSGNFGFGTDSPIYKLDVQGTGRFTGKLTCDNDLVVDTDKFFVDKSTGKIGIGTNSATAPLHITKDDDTNGQLLVEPVSTTGKTGKITIRSHRNASTSNNSSQLLFENYDNDLTASNKLGMISGIVSNVTTNVGDLAFFTYSDGSTISERMRITGGGNIGIGTDSPSNGKLEINGTSGSTNLGAYSYGELTTSGTSLGTVKTGASYSIYASGPIAASEFNAVSDIRVKNIKEIRNNKKDMETLEQMNVYEFDYIDKLNYGTKDKIGFIAQDLEKLNNNLINYSKNYIPNIFKTFKLINKNKIILDKEYDLEVNDMLKIEITVYSQKIMIEKKILEKNNNEIIIEIIELIEGEDIFVYGKKVDDFRTVNFEQIIGMNVSSIKYLYNEIKEIKNNQEKLYNLIKNKLNI